MSSIRHPLEDVSSISHLLNLPYFEFLSCFGLFSMHPGGLDQTINLMEDAGLNDSDRILEIGCGTGLTSQMLHESRIEVHLLEPNIRLLQSTLNLCAQSIPKKVPFYLTQIEDISKVPKAHFTMAIMEAVFGFVGDKDLALRNIKKLLTGEDQRLAVIDFCYHTAPPKTVITEFKKLVGIDLQIFFQHDWEQLFKKNHFDFEKFVPFALPPINSPKPGEIKNMLEANNIIQFFPEAIDEHLKLCSDRWKVFNDLFDENKKYLYGFRAVVS